MKLPNGYGGISKLPGARRRPFRVRITKGWITDDEGKVKQQYGTLGYYKTRKEAMIALAEYNDNPYDLDVKKITFGQIFDKWLERDKASMSEGNIKAAKGFRAYLCSLEDMPMCMVKLTHLQTAMDEVIKQGKSNATQAKVKILMSKTFKYAIEHDIIEKNYTPFVRVSSTKPTREEQEKLITTEEIQALISQPDEMFIGKPYKGVAPSALVGDIPMLLLYTGCRINELLAMKVDDIHISERWMHIPGTKTRTADRTVPIHRKIELLLQRRIDNAVNGYLFHWDGKKLPYHIFLKYWAKLMERLGQSHTPHDTRHTFISIMDRVGVGASSVVLKRIVGHSNTSITEHYTHKGLDDLLAAIDKYTLD